MAKLIPPLEMICLAENDLSGIKVSVGSKVTFVINCPPDLNSFKTIHPLKSALPILVKLVLTEKPSSLMMGTGSTFISEAIAKIGAGTTTTPPPPPPPVVPPPPVEPPPVEPPPPLAQATVG